MNQVQLAMSIANSNNGVITSEMADSKNIKRQILSYLVSKGLLSKTGRGVYTTPLSFDDPYLNIQTRFKRGVYSEISALYLLNLTDIIPNKIYITFPQGYNCTNPNNGGLICRTTKKPELGKTIVKDMMGNYVSCYNAERTLCDIVKKRNDVDIRIIVDAFKTYCISTNKNIPLLMEYSSIFKVEKQIRNYLEVLL